ncbi:MAG: hypothetical protein WDN69_26525 [Aliidongia sp.]
MAASPICPSGRWSSTPQTTTTLYAGTDQGGGVFKSTDGGASWTALGSAPGVVNGLAIDPHTSTTLYAAEEQSGLLKSTDGGATFSPIGAGTLPTFPTFVALAIDPNTTARSTSASRLTASSRARMAATAGLPPYGLTGGSLINAQALVINPQSTSTLYAAVDTGTGKIGVYGSTNGAGSWTLLSSLGTDDGNSALVLNPQTPSTLYAGGYGLGVLQSTNGGASFAPGRERASPTTMFSHSRSTRRAQRRSMPALRRRVRHRECRFGLGCREYRTGVGEYRVRGGRCEYADDTLCRDRRQRREPSL